MRRHVWLWALALVVVGCGSTVEDTCETIAQECPDAIDRGACQRDGLELEEVAENVDCEPSFEAHLDCVDEAQCQWEERCAATLDELQRCVTGL